MCKFHNKLFMFVLLTIGLALLISPAAVNCTPIETLLEEYLDAAAAQAQQADNDYDIQYDERQNGTENYRLKIDGVVIGIPGASSNSIGSLGLLATNYLAQLATAASYEDEDNDNENDGFNSDNKPYEYENPHEKNNSSDAKPITDDEPQHHYPDLIDLIPELFDFKSNNDKVTNKKDLKVEAVAVIQPDMVAAMDTVSTSIDNEEHNNKPVTAVKEANLDEQHSRQKSSGPQKKRNK